ncbi:hypothetical protein ACFWIB_11005 [Streptomyces sp. NPDC127051]|uniref:hypothetical protein n=1 Tax=Streptomyces sp. NPDC127051 TaxID=3347119 RepID=UPI003652E578
MTAQQAVTATLGRIPDGPATTVTGALFVDMANIRARYECLRCGRREGPVSGTDVVVAFVRSIRTDHHTRCLPQEPPS